MILEDFSANSLIRAIEDNAVEGTKAWAAWPELELHEEEDLVWMMTDIDFPFFNCFLSPRLSTDNAEEKIEASKRQATNRNVSISWWLGPRATPGDLEIRLSTSGFMKIAEPIGMAVDLELLAPTHPAPRGIRIQEVTNDRQLHLWCDVTVPVHEFPDFAQEAWYEMYQASGYGDHSGWRHYIGLLDATPVAASSLFIGAGVASIANVSTLPNFRNRGFGAAISSFPLTEARRDGYRVGTLWSSEMGESVYLKLGFKEYCRAPVFIWSP
jgi:GNAT superfamily N-acetyltransferase